MTSLGQLGGGAPNVAAIDNGYGATEVEMGRLLVGVIGQTIAVGTRFGASLRLEPIRGDRSHFQHRVYAPGVGRSRLI